MTQNSPVFNPKAWKLIRKTLSTTVSPLQVFTGISLVLAIAVLRARKHFIDTIILQESIDRVKSAGSTEDASSKNPPSVVDRDFTTPDLAIPTTRSLVEPSNLIGEGSTSPISFLPSNAPTVSPLDSGFRKKYVFSGFTGADRLGRMGTYTEDEYNTIVQLKAADAPTGHTRSMPEEVENYIIESAARHGVDKELALRVARMESGGNTLAISQNGAIGIYQFTGETATEFGLKNRFDYRENIDAGMRLLRARSLSIPAGRVSILTSYLTLQLGSKGAGELLSVPESTLISSLSTGLQAQLRDNYGGDSSTVADYLAKTQKALDAYASKSTYNAPASPVLPLTPAIPRKSSSNSTPSSSTPAIRVGSSTPGLATDVIKFRGTAIAFYG